MSATPDSSSRAGSRTPQSLVCRDRTVALDGFPKIVGIVNITEDSFFDGGRHFSTDAAVKHGLKLVEEGAAMLDVGGQSTRPGFAEISIEEEISRVVPVISSLVAKTFVPISVDTYKPAVAEAALKAGAHVVNDIYGFQREPGLACLAAGAGAAAILMHNDATFRSLATDPVAGVIEFLERSADIARRIGLARERLIFDPGIGFAKTQEQNLALLGRMSELRKLGAPLLLGASRKSVIGNILQTTAEERLEGTLATTALAVWQGVEFIRVHDVRANLRTAQVAAAIRRQSLP